MQPADMPAQDFYINARWLHTFDTMQLIQALASINAHRPAILVFALEN